MSKTTAGFGIYLAMEAFLCALEKRDEAVSEELQVALGPSFTHDVSTRESGR